MANYLQFLSIVLPVVALAWGIYIREWLGFIVVIIGGHGAVIAGQNYQTTGHLGALLGCYACMLIAGLELRKLLGRDKITRKERKCWKLLMGESAWGMIRYDPRLKGWWFGK